MSGAPMFYASPEQANALQDRLGDSEGGVYLPVRKTSAGKFTMPLYGAPAVDARAPKATAVTDAAGDVLDERQRQISAPEPSAPSESPALATMSRPTPWRDMATAPKDGSLLRLLVDFEQHATEDRIGPQPTIGSNTWDNHHDFDVWQFAGWNWEQDCYTQGVGTPVGWLPMLDAALSAHPVAAPSAAAGERVAGLPDLRNVVAMLRENGRFEDEEGEATDALEDLIAWIERASTTPAAAPVLAALNDDLIAILGRPNFTCIRLAQALRLCGVDIKPKAEHEQAAVIHFLLTRYLRHGGDWAVHSDADLRAMLDRAEAKNKAAMGVPVEKGAGDGHG